MLVLGGKGSGWKCKGKLNYVNTLNENIVAVSGKVNVNNFVAGEQLMEH